MFGFRRHRRPSLLNLILALLGIRFLVRECREACCGERMDREEYRAKMKRFRHKMREALAVWKEEEPAAGSASDAPAPDAQA